MTYFVIYSQVCVVVNARSTWAFSPSMTPTHLFHTSFELMCCKSHKISSQSRGCKNSENRVNFNAKSVCLLRSSLNSYIFQLHTAFYGEQVAAANNSTRNWKKNNFTFSRSGECFIFEGDLRVGKWGEKARGECAAGLFPPGAASAQSLNTMQSHTHTHRRNDKTANKGNYGERTFMYICARVCFRMRRSARTSTAARFSFNPFIVHAWNMLVIMPLMSLLQINTFRGRRCRLHSFRIFTE